MITDDELGRMSDKSSREAALVDLYRGHDFITAYAKHTDIRVERDPQLAIGGDWEEYGILQRDFLISQGLHQGHKFFEVGCGTGRLARRIVPYLDDRCYLGIDISPGALAHAERLSVSEGWTEKHPTFILGEVSQFHIKQGFDFAWAFSVFIHLPSEIASDLMGAVAERLASGGKFLFSYSPTELADNTRTGLKQFKHPFSFYESVAHRLGCALKELKWPARQHILEMRR